MNHSNYFAGCIFCFLVFVSCSMGTNSGSGSGYTQNLSGKIGNSSFSALKSFYSSNTSNKYQIDIWGSNGTNISSNVSSSYTIYPYIEINVPNTISQNTYNVTTFGSGVNAIQITCWTSTFGGSWIDSGNIEITKNLNGTIKLVFQNCKTTDNSTILNGTITANSW